MMSGSPQELTSSSGVERRLLPTYRAIYDCLHYEGFIAGDGQHGYRRMSVGNQAYPQQVPTVRF
jgi:hypothetical protein